RQVASLPALLVVGNELVDLAADDRALVRLFARRDALLEHVPVDLGRRRRALLAAATHRLCLLPVAEHLETHPLVNGVGRKGRLVELNPELLHPDGGDADQWASSS